MDQQIVPPVIFNSSSQTQTGNAICASRFRQQPNIRCVGRLGAHVSAIAQDELDTLKQSSPNEIFKINDPPGFRKEIANDQLEKPLATTTSKFDFGNNTFAERFVTMKKLTGPIIGLHFTRKNSVVIDTTHGLIQFPHLTMQVKSTSEMSAKPKVVLTDDARTIPPRTTTTVTAFNDHPSEWNTTGTVTPLKKFTETASLLISHSMSTIIDKKVAARGTNTTETPYLIKTNTQIAEFCVVTPEQATFIKPVDKAILSMIPECDLDLTTYLNEPLRTNKPEQKKKHFLDSHT